MFIRSKVSQSNRFEDSLTQDTLLDDILGLATAGRIHARMYNLQCRELALAKWGSNVTAGQTKITCVFQ